MQRREATRDRVKRSIENAPPQSYFLVSATFHYLGPSFAVLLFARLDVLGVAWLRISRLPLATVSAIEFLPVILLAALGARTTRNVIALLLAIAGVYLLTDVRLAGDALGFVFAFANALLFSAYIVLADRVAKRPELSGIDGLAAAMIIAAVIVTPIGGRQALPAFSSPTVLLAGIGVGVSSSVIPYVTDQLAMVRLARATYATMLALLPAIATVIGVIVLAQIPTATDVAGLVLIVAGVAIHRPHDARRTQQ